MGLVKTYDSVPNLQKHITDSLMHCDSQVNKRIGIDLVRVLKEYNVFRNVDEDIEDSTKIVFGLKTKLIPEIYMLKNSKFEEYLSSIRPYYKEGRNGAIVMNCNPFTNGLCI